MGDAAGGGFGNRLTYSTNDAIPYEVWSHVAVVIAEDESGIIYLDGVPSILSQSGGNPPGDIRYFEAPFRIGQKWNNFFVGALDDIKLFSRVLSPGEVANLANDQISSVQTPVQRVVCSPTLASDHIRVEMGSSLISWAYAIAADGKVISASLIDGNTIDVSRLTAGMYRLSDVTIEGREIQGEFIVHR